MDCPHCHEPLSGRRVYCDARCKQAAYRRRRAGVDADHLAGVGRRGRVPLGGLTGAALVDELREIAEAIAFGYDRDEAIKAGRAALRRATTIEASRRLEESEKVLDELERFRRNQPGGGSKT